MTKKGYIIIAQAINAERYASPNQNQLSIAITLNGLARVLAGKMAEDNKRFDRIKFLNMCGVSKNSI